MNVYIGPLFFIMPPHILDNSDFDKRLSALGPFERRPHLAVAVSGGSDSLSLVLLASRWVACRGGRVTALSVDHELRAESTKEIEQVSKWLRSKGYRSSYSFLGWKKTYSWASGCSSNRSI